MFLLGADFSPFGFVHNSIYRQSLKEAGFTLLLRVGARCTPGDISTTSCRFQATVTAKEATRLTDGILLPRHAMANASLPKESPTFAVNDQAAVLPWIGFGTYKLGKTVAYETILEALECGYRCIDTAFIYGGETTERHVGNAIQAALEKKIIQSRQEIFVTTKHWRKYHGYKETLECLRLSLKRLQLDYVDLYLMHWPGPAWNTMHRKTDVLEQEGPWHYAADNCKDPTQMAQLRAETWRAMEDAWKQGKVKRIGVSNFSVEHLKTLKKTAQIWPPAVNQVEFHPLYPQVELLEYCRQEGIVLQAYASLGGQDTGKKQWNELQLDAGEASSAEKGAESSENGKKKPKQKKLKDTAVSLLKCLPVVSLAAALNATPAQILLSWALSQNCTVIPKASSRERMEENAASLDFPLTQEQVSKITNSIQTLLSKQVDGNSMQSSKGRLCWRNDPLRLLDFE